MNEELSKSLEIRYLTKYSPRIRKSAPSNRFYQILCNQYHKQKKITHQMMKSRNDCLKELDIFKQRTPHIRKRYHRIKQKMNYDEERKSIPNEDDVVINYIDYNLLKNSQCCVYTGCTRKHIIYIAELADLPSEDVFYVRERIYTMGSYKYRSNVHQISPATLKGHFSKCIYKIEQGYAKKFLINSKPWHLQYWQRKKVIINTPKFVYKVMQINPQTGLSICLCFSKTSK